MTRPAVHLTHHHSRAATPPWIPLLVILAATVTLTACGPKNFVNENDQLRARVADLTEQNQKLQTDLTATQKALAVQQRESGVALPPGLTLPVVSRIEIGSYSGLADHSVRLYLETYDQQGRFLPVIGGAKVTLSYTLPGQPAVTLATADFTPQQVDAGYRSGFAGTHYTLTIPLTKPIPADVHELLASVSFTDFRSGVTLKTQKAVRAE